MHSSLNHNPVLYESIHFWTVPKMFLIEEIYFRLLSKMGPDVRGNVSRTNRWTCFSKRSVKYTEIFLNSCVKLTRLHTSYMKWVCYFLNIVILQIFSSMVVITNMRIHVFYSFKTEALLKSSHQGSPCKHPQLLLQEILKII